MPARIASRFENARATRGAACAGNLDCFGPSDLLGRAPLRWRLASSLPRLVTTCQLRQSAFKSHRGLTGFWARSAGQKSTSELVQPL